MVCDAGCGTKCTTIDAGTLQISNIIILPSETPTPTDYVSVQADISNYFPVSIDSVRLCVYDDVTGQCIASTGTRGLLTYETATFGPITIGTMPAQNWRIQVGPKMTRVPGWYDCGQFQAFTLKPTYPPGAMCICGPNGCVQSSAGTLDCGVCNATCVVTGGKTCTSSADCTGVSDMCVMGTCIPKAFVAIALFGAMYMLMKKD